MEQDIRTVEIEFLRPGPPHNQLLSPLTQYLAVCGDAGAGTVSMPFEQAAFNRRLADLRYLDDDEQDQAPRLETLRILGSALGEVLGAVPGLIGSLTDQPGTTALTNLRIVSSASELAMLPFELAKMPAAAGRPSDEWLSLRAGTPICVTRRERSVRPTEQRWTPVRPKVLFVVGVGVDAELETRHRQALADALEPWRYDSGGRRAYYDHQPLVQLGGQHPDRDGPCTVPRIRNELERGAALVHFLAHGAPSDTTEGERVGLLLQGDERADEEKHEATTSSVVVTGEQLASVLRSLPAESPRPWGILLASCDSAYQADLIVPGGSFARALHVAGVPLVLASQFPLTYEGSILMTTMLARDIFWGGNPLSTIASIRAEMHAELGTSHDWASLVVYDALPTDLNRLLDRVRYDRARSALDTVVLRMEEESWSPGYMTTMESEAESVLARLPDAPAYEIDRLSLRAYYSKRLAERYHLGEQPRRCRRHLAAARQQYRVATRCFLASKVSEFGANLHWMHTQAISLDHVLGSTPKPGEWEQAWQAAQLDLDLGDNSARLWAHSDLAELALLKLLDDDTMIDGKTAESVARHHIERLVESGPAGQTNYVAQSVKYQFVRYRDWFGAYARPERQGDDVANWQALVQHATLLLQDFLEAEVGVAMFRVEMLPARHGDCILIGYGTPKRARWILIDAGTEPTWSDLKRRLATVPRLELFVLTHIDADHIAGAIPLLGRAHDMDLEIGDIWFNGWPQIRDQHRSRPPARSQRPKRDRTLSAKQGEIFSALLADPDRPRPWNAEFEGGPVQVTQDSLPVVELPGSIRLTILSPTPAKLGRLHDKWSTEITRHGLIPGRHSQFRKFLAREPETRTDSAYLANTRFTSDSSTPNASSIAFLAEYRGRAALFTGDAVPSVLITSIKRLLAQRRETRLQLDAFKLSHHGSRGNTNTQLLSLLDCNRYLISCNGDVHNLPDNEAIGRIIQGGGTNPELIFNYNCPRTEMWGTAKAQEGNPAYTATYGDNGHIAIELQPGARPRKRGGQ